MHYRYPQSRLPRFTKVLAGWVKTRRLSLLAGLLLAISVAAAEQKPKWELGAGVTTISLADYRGSREYSSISLPFPYLEYRGQFLRADREEGVRGRLFENTQLELNISGAFSPTVDTDDNPLREGMPALDPTFEIGAALDVNLSGASLKEGWLIRLPVRAVYAVADRRIEHIGWLAHPHLAYRHRYEKWSLRAYAGPLLADNAYHDYYYRVAPEYVRAWRNEYNPGGGYSGLASGISVTRRWGRLWAGAFIRYDNLAGARFETSPLVETRHYFAAGIGAAWVFAAENTAGQ
jgi:outer membrane scaffolding protein for murein synthesis (MipA/OmpV family)